MKFKLNKNSVKNVAIFSAALALNPTVAYASTQNMENIHTQLAPYIILMGTFALASYKDIRNIEKERLYRLHKILIPAQNNAIQFLKDRKDEYNSKKIKYEIETERKFLKRLLREEKELCDKFKIDIEDDEQMTNFIEEIEKKQTKENIVKKNANKVKTLFAK